MDVQEYLDIINEKLNSSRIIESVENVTARFLLNQGYFRARLSLVNQDFLEIAESFRIENSQIITLDYRYQWMDGSKQVLKKRWDSVKHFPKLPNFPHHVHVGDESIVEPGILRSIPAFLDFLEKEFEESG